MKPYYQDDFCTIYNGDCREILPILPTVDHVITDPPYAEKTHNGARGDGHLGGEKKLVSFGSITATELQGALSACDVKRWIIATVDWRHINTLEDFPPNGMRFVRFGIWVKPNGMPQFTGDRPATGWEAVAILHKDGGRMQWNGGGNRAVWTFNIAQGEHPTEKPVPLASEFVRLFTDTSETILDPFMGSGTTLVAAKQLGRRAIGIEIEEMYCEIAAKRLQQEYLPLSTPPAPQPRQGEML